MSIDDLPRELILVIIAKSDHTSIRNLCLTCTSNSLLLSRVPPDNLHILWVLPSSQTLCELLSDARIRNEQLMKTSGYFSGNTSAKLPLPLR